MSAEEKKSKIMKNWFFIIVLSLAAMALAGTAAWFSVFGLTQLFYGAGIGITILAASLEFAKVVTVSYVYRFWKQIEKGLKWFYIFAVLFIMFLTSMGIYGFLISGYQKSANKIELRDAQIKIADNKRTLFVNQLDRVNKSIESSTQRINIISGLRTQQEKRLDNLYNQKYISVAKRTETQISGSDEQIRILNEDITLKMKQTSVINDSIAFYDQKIAELKSSEVNNEISSYQFISDLTGIPMNRVVNFVAFVIIFVFDPLAIALLIAVNRLTMNSEEKEARAASESQPSFWNKIKKKIKKVNKIPTESEPFAGDWINQSKPIQEKTKEEIVEEKIETPELKEEIIIEPIQMEEIRNFPTEKPKEYDEFEPKQIASVTGRVNVAHFIPKD